jgi:hypothetical protein
MPDLLDPPLSDLRADLQRLRGLLNLVQAVREFGATDPPTTNGDGEFGQASRGLRDQIRGLSSELPMFSGTLLLYLAGRFEHFVRMSFQSICDGFGAKCTTFDQLPDRMKASLRLHSAEVVMNPSRFGFDEVEAMAFVVNLAGNYTAVDGLGTINSGCLSVTQNNMTPGTLSELYGRVGLKSTWPEMGKQAALKVFFECTSDSDAEKAGRAELEELMAARNQIAHPSGSPSFPDPTKVLRYVEFVEVLSGVLTEVSRVHLIAFKVL